jgi:hypothetical protein
MVRFRFAIRDGEGRQRTGVMQAHNLAEAEKMVSDRGFTLLEMTLIEEDKSPKPSPGPPPLPQTPELPPLPKASSLTSLRVRPSQPIGAPPASLPSRPDPGDSGPGQPQLLRRGLSAAAPVSLGPPPLDDSPVPPLRPADSAARGRLREPSSLPSPPESEPREAPARLSEIDFRPAQPAQLAPASKAEPIIEVLSTVARAKKPVNELKFEIGPAATQKKVFRTGRAAPLALEQGPLSRFGAFLLQGRSVNALIAGALIVGVLWIGQSSMHTPSREAAKAGAPQSLALVCAGDVSLSAGQSSSGLVMVVDFFQVPYRQSFRWAELEHPTPLSYVCKVKAKFNRAPTLFQVCAVKPGFFEKTSPPLAVPASEARVAVPTLAVVGPKPDN